MKKNALVLLAVSALGLMSPKAEAQSAMIEVYGGYELSDGTTQLDDFFKAKDGTTNTFATGFIWSQFKDGHDDGNWQWMLDLSYRSKATSYTDIAAYHFDQFTADSLYSADYKYLEQSVRVGIGGQITSRMSRNIHNGELAFTMPILATFDLGYRQAYGQASEDLLYTESDFGMDQLDFGLTIAPGVRYSRPFHDNRYQRFSVGLDFPAYCMLVTGDNSGTGEMAFQYGIPYARLRVGWIF